MFPASIEAVPLTPESVRKKTGETGEPLPMVEGSCETVVKARIDHEILSGWIRNSREISNCGTVAARSAVIHPKQSLCEITYTCSGSSFNCIWWDTIYLCPNNSMPNTNCRCAAPKFCTSTLPTPRFMRKFCSVKGGRRGCLIRNGRRSSCCKG